MIVSDEIAGMIRTRHSTVDYAAGKASQSCAQPCVAARHAVSAEYAR
jgi:hypothetical protein